MDVPSETYADRLSRLGVISFLFKGHIDQLVDQYRRSYDALPDSDPRSAFGEEASRHYGAILSAERFAFEDLTDLLSIEKEVMRGLAVRVPLSDSGLAWKREQAQRKLSRLTRSHPIWLSTLVDNLYNLIADVYGIERTKRAEQRRSIHEQLHPFNRQLASYLRENITFSRTQGQARDLRDVATHSVAFIEALLGDNLEEAVHMPFLSRGERQEDLYAYLFGFYSHTLERTLGAMKLLLDVPSTAPAKL